jgi:glycosyltransferase involved in cell wall biosynthesis
MTISVLIPTYNRSIYLREAIESVLAQTLLPDEIIIGDDSEDFETEEMIAKLMRTTCVPIRYYHNLPSLKQTNNVDFLFKKSCCDLLLLLHDDDLLFPSCLEVLKEPLEAFPKVLATYGNQVLIDERSDYIKGSESVNASYFRTANKVGLVDGYSAGIVSMFPNNGFLIRRKEALLVGYSDDGKAGDAVDFYFGYRVGKLKRPFFYINEFTAKYRLTSNSVSKGNDNDAAYQVIKILFEDLVAQDFTTEVKRSIQNRLPIAISQAIRKKDRRNAFIWLFSKYYRSKILTLRGIKRLLMLIYPF